MATLAEIRRHPVKGLGAQVMNEAMLRPGLGLPFDRRWAVAHAATSFDPEYPAWAKRSNFAVVAQVPRLARTVAAYDEATGQLGLDHPEAEPISLTPEAEPERLSAWVEALCKGGRPGPYFLASLPGEAALTDVEEAHLSILSTRSLAVLSEVHGRALERHRFRGNLWIDGLDPWQEFEWVGREITIGPVRLRVTQRTGRCTAPGASPETGERDADIVRLLAKRYGHTDFGVEAQVIEGGRIAPGDPVSA
ncbi:MAG: MOSC domain-containing protein [Pseudomonadota bacterium]